MTKRFCRPTHLDEADYLTEWRNELEDGSIEIWIQTSKEEKSKWVRIGDLLERVWLKFGCIPCDMDQMTIIDLLLK